MLDSGDPTPARLRSTSQLRGEETRKRILSAALRVFATSGYEGASTRALARAAGVNLPAIQYYFGSKDGLYRAVIDQIIETVELRIAPVIRQIRDTVAAGQTSHQTLLELLCRMMDAFVALVTDQTSSDWESRALFFARAEVEPQIALDTLHRRITRQFVEPCALLVGMLTGQPADAEGTRLRTVALIGQVSVFCNHKARLVLDWHELDDRRVRAIQAVVREHTQAIFGKINGAAP